MEKFYPGPLLKKYSSPVPDDSGVSGAAIACITILKLRRIFYGC